MNITTLATRQKLTARLLFQRVGSPVVDLGNVLLVKQEPKIDRTQQMTARRGYMQVTHEEPAKVDPRWSFKLTEMLGPQMRLLNLAKESLPVEGDYSDTLTAGGTIAAGTIFFTKRSNIQLGALVQDYNVSGLETILVQGTDFSVDQESGKITILQAITPTQNLTAQYLLIDDLPIVENLTATLYPPVNPYTFPAGTSFNLGYVVNGIDRAFYDPADNNVTILEGVDYSIDRATGQFTTLVPITVEGHIEVTFSARASSAKIYTMISEAFVRGVAKLVLSDQLGLAPIEQHTFNAEIKTTDWGDHDGQKNTEFTLELLALGAPLTQFFEVRPTGATRPVSFATTAGEFYQLQYQAPDGTWVNIAPQFSCSNDQAPAATFNVDTAYVTVRLNDLGPDPDFVH